MTKGAKKVKPNEDVPATETAETNLDSPDLVDEEKVSVSSTSKDGKESKKGEPRGPASSSAAVPEITTDELEANPTVRSPAFSVIERYYFQFYVPGEDNNDVYLHAHSNGYVVVFLVGFRFPHVRALLYLCGLFVSSCSPLPCVSR